MIFQHHHDTGSRMRGLLPLQWTVLRAGMNWQSLHYTIWKWTLVSIGTDLVTEHSVGLVTYMYIVVYNVHTSETN